MSTLKIDRINSAYSKLRISGMTVDPSAEDNTLALNVLETLMNELYDKNVCVGYNFEDIPDLNTTSGIKRSYHNAIDSILAFRLMTNFGKGFAPDQTLVAQANAGISYLFSTTASPKPTQYPSRQPIGGANTLRLGGHIRYYQPIVQAPNNCATKHIALDTDNPNINDYIEHFNSYLKNNETINSFSIEADTGLTILSSSISGNDILYTIRADGTGQNSTVLQVKIVITTSESRVLTRLVTFELEETNL